jgi:protein-disulfide isomerase
MDKTTEAAVLPNPRRRQLLIGGAVLVAVLAAGGGYYAWRASSPLAKSSVAEPPGGADVSMAELMTPGPLGDNALGSPNAPVTIIEYASMTCPHCAHFHETTYPELKKRYIDTGKVRFIFREFPLDALAAAGSMLARCAGSDKYFPMIETLFAQQRDWVVQKPLEPMLGIARQAGFTQQSFDECLANQEMLAGIEDTRTRAMKLGVNSTPTFFINGKIFRGGLTPEELERQLAPYLKA